MNHEQWLAERKKGIGGSDIGAILCAIGAYKTPYEVWLDKTGKAEPEPESKVKKRGKIMENCVALLWEDESGLELRRERPNVIYKHNDHKFLLGTPDRFYDDKNTTGVLEIKTSIPNIDLDSPPQSWFCQLQWYMGITRCYSGEIAILGSYYKVNRIPYNFVPDFFENMVEQGVNFWEKHVLADIPPPLTRGSDVDLMFKKHVDGKMIEATPEVAMLCEEFKGINERRKAIEKEEKDIKERLKLIMRDAEGIKIDDQVLVTWKASKDGYTFDEKEFQKSLPQVYKQFLVPSPGSRRMLPK